VREIARRMGRAPSTISRHLVLDRGNRSAIAALVECTGADDLARDLADSDRAFGLTGEVA